MKLSVNLARQRYIDRRRLRMLYGVLLGLLLAWLFVTVRFSMSTAGRHHRMARWLEETALPERTLVVSDAGAGRDAARLAAEGAFVRHLIRQRRVRWSTVLERLEQVAVEGIQIRTIEPDYAHNVLEIEVLARDIETLRKYLGGMLRFEGFSEVLLLHQDTRKITAGQGRSLTALHCRIKIAGGFRHGEE
jgi:Tfp pilus assembly protein PilN